jgi:hypothetical protein
VHPERPRMRYAANSDRTVLPRAWTGERRFLGGGSAERVAGDQDYNEQLCFTRTLMKQLLTTSVNISSGME